MTRTMFVNGCQVEVNHDGTSIFVDGKVIKTYLQSKGSKKKNSGKFYCCNIGGKSYLVHRLVAQAFIPNPENLPYATHIDTNTENNDYRNLWWGNQRTIVWHMKSAGRSYKNANNDRVNSKIPFEKIPDVVNMICDGLTLKQIGEKFNTTGTSIYRIKKRYCGSLTIGTRGEKVIH